MQFTALTASQTWNGSRTHKEHKRPTSSHYCCRYVDAGGLEGRCSNPNTTNANQFPGCLTPPRLTPREVGPPLFMLDLFFSFSIFLFDSLINATWQSAGSPATEYIHISTLFSYRGFPQPSRWFDFLCFSFSTRWFWHRPSRRRHYSTDALQLFYLFRLTSTTVDMLFIRDPLLSFSIALVAFHALLLVPVNAAPTPGWHRRYSLSHSHQSSRRETGSQSSGSVFKTSPHVFSLQQLEEQVHPDLHPLLHAQQVAVSRLADNTR